MISEVLDIITCKSPTVASLFSFFQKRSGNCFIKPAAISCMMFELQHCHLEEKSYRTHGMEAGSIRVQGMSIWLIEATYKCIWLQRISVGFLNLFFVGVFCLWGFGSGCLFFTFAFVFFAMSS